MAAVARGDALLPAVRTALLANSSITAIVGAEGVVSRAVEATAMPYIEIGEVSAEDAGTSSSDAEVVNFDVHIWVRDGRDATRARTLRAAIQSTLHHSSLSGLSGLVLLRCEQSVGPIADEDAAVSHYVVTCRAIIGHV